MKKYTKRPFLRLIDNVPINPAETDCQFAWLAAARQDCGAEPKTVDRVAPDIVKSQRLLAHLSHEIRTPLNAILGYAEVMEAGYAGPLTKSQRDYLRNIRNAGTALVKEIENLLDYASIEAGAFPIDRRDHALSGVVIEVLSMTRAQCVEKDIDVIVGECDVTVFADKYALELALSNIISSCCRRLSYRGVIEISGRVQDGEVTILIRDDGVSIPENLVGILEKGSVLASDAYRREADRSIGLELELPIARALVALHDGTFSIESSFESGTSIWVVLQGRQSMGCSITEKL